MADREGPHRGNNDDYGHSGRDGQGRGSNNPYGNQYWGRNNNNGNQRHGDNNRIENTQRLATLHHNKRLKTEEPSRYVPADLTPDQRTYRTRFFKQLTLGDGEEKASSTPLQAFRPRVTLEQKEEAAEYAIQKASERQAEKKKANKYCHSSSEESCPGAGTRTNDPPLLENGQIKFFKNLATCLPLTTGFDIEGSTDIKYCYCPCGKDLANWRAEDENVNKLLDKEDVKIHDGKKPKVFVPIGLMDHLKKIGGSCILHFGTWNYIEKLYENYNGFGECISCSTNFFTPLKMISLLILFLPISLFQVLAINIFTN